MARLCIRILPNDHPTDPSLTPLRTGEGDVVQIVEDSHVFSFSDLNCGHYRILDLPGVPQEELLHLVTPRNDAQGKMTARRTQNLDPVALKGAPWSGRASTNKAQLATITRTKP